MSNAIKTTQLFIYCLNARGEAEGIDALHALPAVMDSKATWWRYANGRSDIGLSKAERACGVCNTTLADIMRSVEELKYYLLDHHAWLEIDSLTSDDFVIWDNLKMLCDDLIATTSISI